MSRLALLASLCFASLAAAQPVAVFVGEAVNLPAGDVAAFSAVCTAEYGRVAGREVVTAAKAQAALQEHGTPAAAAKELGLAEYTEYSLVRLPGGGDEVRILVNAARKDASGVALHAVSLEMASLADAPALCNRVQGALQRRVAVEATRDRSNVTTAEANQSQGGPRLGTEKVIGFKVGFGLPVGDGGMHNPVATVAFDARLERERYFLELGAGALVPATVQAGLPTYGGITSEIGASVYVMNGDIAPYVGGGIMPRIIFGGGSIVNFAPYLQGGVMFWRESSTRLFVDLRVAQNVLPTGGVMYGGTSTPTYPTELNLLVGMGF